MKVELILVILLISILAFGSCSIKPIKSKSEDVKIGLFYYVWYNGTLGQGHWNGTPSDDPTSKKWAVVDEPLLGFYNSSDPKTIKQHMEWFKLLGVDFLIISWWGMNSFEDAVTKILFQQAEVYYPDLKLVIMVEGFNERADNYDFGYIRNYIKTTYYDVYPNMSLRINNLPLLCWYNAENMTGTVDKPRPDRVAQIHNDSLFEDRIIGHNNYVDWCAWTPSTVNSSRIPVLRDGFTVVEPRFDYSHINSTFESYDPNYSEGLYEEQWSQVANWTKTQDVRYAAIYSWNEYHERSQIEPHNTTDSNLVLKPFVETYHNMLTIPEFPSFLILPLFFITTLLGVIFCRKKLARARAYI